MGGIIFTTLQKFGRTNDLVRDNDRGTAGA